MDKRVIVFQGDSITDAGRSREHDAALGQGYPTFVAGRLGAREPNAYQIYNRGISGNRVVDLYARWKRDCLNLRPDVISILIGVNDVWHEIGNHDGVEAPKFERVYDMLLEETRAALPNARIIVLEPFVLKACATEAAWRLFEAEVALRAGAARRVAHKYGADFLPLQAMFDECLRRAPAECWLSDGVHPALAGHQLIADRWLECFDLAK